jgi:DNA-binding transcriptional LysR family regulator
MKIEAFTTLAAVLRNGTMADAAREMNLTPGAVSMQIKQIEGYLGQPLFDRSGLHVKPHPLAHQVSALIGGAVTQLQALRRVPPPVAIEGAVRLGVISSMQPVLVPGTVRLLRDRHPHLRVLQTRGKSAELIDAVKAGTLDAAVVAQPESGGSARLHWYPLLRRELVLVAPPDTRDASPARLFRRYDWISYDRGTVTGRTAARYAARHFGAKRSIVELDGVPAIVAMVSAGLGVSLVHLSDAGATSAYPVRLLPLPGAPSVQLSLLMRRGDTDKRLLQALVAALDEVAAGVRAVSP